MEEMGTQWKKRAKRGRKEELEWDEKIIAVEELKGKVAVLVLMLERW